MRGVLIAAAVLVFAAPASASSIDQRSTHRFIAASVAALSGAIAAHGRQQPAIDAVIGHLTTGCPGALPDASPGTTAQQGTRAALYEEAVVELSLAFVAPIRAVFPAFARRVAGLHWTRSALDRSVAASVRSGLGTLALVPPDVCGDIAAAAASGFTTIPAETAAFLRAAGRSVLATGPLATDLVGRMQRFIGPGDAAAVGRLHRLQRRLDELFSKPIAAAYARLDRALTGG